MELKPGYLVIQRQRPQGPLLPLRIPLPPHRRRRSPLGTTQKISPVPTYINEQRAIPAGIQHYSIRQYRRLR